MTGLFGLFIFGLIIYFLFKNLRAILHTLFGPSAQQNNFDPYKNQRKQTDQQSTAPKQQPESKNRIIHDDEGEYVDFEEVHDNSEKK